MKIAAQGDREGAYLVPSPLNEERWKPFQGLEHAGAVSLVSSITKYWNAYMGHPLAILDGDDGGLYDYIYASLDFPAEPDRRGR